MTGLGYEPVKAVLARFGLYRLARRAPAATDPLSLPWKDKMRILEALTAGDWHAPRIDRSDLARGKPATALKECRKLVRLNPHDWMGLIYMGEILDQGNRPEEAARAFEKALDEQPLCEHVRLMLAKQKIRLGQLDTAGDLLAEETRRFGENTETIYLTALHHQKRGNHREAAAGFERFRTLVPNRHDAWQSLMESLTELKDREGLRRVFAEAANTGNRKDREWLQTQAAVALARLDADQRPEHETLGHYLQQDPENSLLLYARASALERMGEPERAFSLFEQAARSADTYGHIRAGAWFRLARLSSGEQKKEFARRCLKLDPSHEGARNLLTRPQRDRSEDEKAPATEQRPASEAC